MNSLVVNVRAGTRLVDEIGDSVSFLLVADEVLNRGNDGLLQTSDRLAGELACEVWVIGEAWEISVKSAAILSSTRLTLPVPSAQSYTTKWSSNWTKDSMNAFALELSTHIDSTSSSKSAIPAGTDMQSRGISIDAICASNTIALSLH